MVFIILNMCFPSFDRFFVYSDSRFASDSQYNFPPLTGIESIHLHILLFLKFIISLS